MAVLMHQGREIGRIRRDFGLTQEALARVLGVSARTVARWEAEDTNPSPLARARIELMRDIKERAERLMGRGFSEWLREPNGRLSGERPVDRLQAPDGLDQVRDLLARIEWGIAG